MKKIVSIVGWIVLLMAFAALGLSTDDPTFGFFFYLAFFAIVFGLVYLYTKNHQRRKEADPKIMALVHRIAGIVLLIVSLFSPVIALRKIQLPFGQNLLILFVTAILIALGVFAVSLVNSSSVKKILGLLILVVLAAVPALFAINYLSNFFPNAYNALGTAYWAIVAVSIFSWWGFTLFLKKD